MSDRTPILDATFIVCDVETTGLSPSDSRITEIALIKVVNGELTSKYTTLVNPQQHIPYGITELTGISNEDVYDKPTFADIAHEVYNFIYGEFSPEIIFTGHNVMFDYKFLQTAFINAGYGNKFRLKTLCTCKLARRIHRRLKSKSLSRLCEYYNIKRRNSHRALDDALATAKILMHLISNITENYDLEYIDELLKYQNSKIYTDNHKPPALKRIGLNLRDIPKEHGVYFMKSRSGEVLYIGKAKCLRERISSYFRHNSEMPYKVRNLLANIQELEYEITNSELSALIRESYLIKKLKPRFNSAIKRFRFHPFIKIDVQNDFPKIQKVYEIENDGAYYYGPFSSGLTVNRLLKDIHEKFKLRKCEYKILKPSNLNSTCMYFEMRKCDAPCNFSQSLSSYREEVMKVHNFLTTTEKESVQKIYLKQMTNFSDQFAYERAAFVRDRINDISRVMSYQKVITSAINDKKIIIKCDNNQKREIFFIHNGKLVETYILEKDNQFDQNNHFEKIIETSEYLFFSLNKFIKHKFTVQELDEIKVISNWLALNRDHRKVLEINDTHSKDDIVNFVMN